jgi:hypothetical protein
MNNRARVVSYSPKGDVADVAPVRRVDGQVALEQLGHFLNGRLRDGRTDPPSLLVAADGVLTHYPCDPLAR